MDTPLVCSRHVSWFQRHAQVFAYHDLYGYVMGMSPDVAGVLGYFAEAPRARVDALRDLEQRFEPEAVPDFVATFESHAYLVPEGTDEAAALWDLYPVQARWVAWHQPDPDTLTFWRPDGADPAEPWAARLWDAVDGNHTVGELVDAVAEHPSLEAHGAGARAHALATIASWVHHRRQYLKMARLPLRLLGPEHGWPPYLSSTMPYPPWRPGVDPDPPDPFAPIDEPVAPPHAYYSEGVDDAAAQFDVVETTLSHLFRDAHPALGGRSYAQAAVEALASRGVIGPHVRDVLEVGGGQGHLAAGVLETLRDEQPEVFDGLASYTIVDLSPALREAQEALLAARGLGGRVRWEAWNVEEAEPPEASADLLICNEVVGDLTTVKLTRDHVESALAEHGHAGNGGPPGPGVAAIRRWALPWQDAPEEFFVNVGALHFLEWAWRALRPGGAALITEFGEPLRYPVPSLHLDHLEFSIHFGWMAHVAERLGFEVEYVAVIDLLGLDFDMPMLASTRTWLLSAQRMLSAHGLTLDKRAWTQAQIDELLGDVLPRQTVGELRFRPLNERCMGLAPHEFKALVLRRP